VAEFIAGRHLRRHVQKMRAVYQKRQRFLLDALNEHLGDLLVPMESRYGMHLSATASGDVDLAAMPQAVRKEGIELHTRSRYYLGTPVYNGIVFSYGTATIPELRKAISSLGAAARRAGYG